MLISNDYTISVYQIGLIVGGVLSDPLMRDVYVLLITIFEI